MEERKQFKIVGQPVNLVVGILILAIFAIGLFNLASFLFWVFRVIAPILIIATVIMDHKVILNYGKWVIEVFRKNPIGGIALGIGTAVFYPLVAAFLFGKVLIRKQLKDAKKQKEDEFVNFEEMDSKPLEFPELRKESRDASSNYEDLVD